jgi:hypothetical protein
MLKELQGIAVRIFFLDDWKRECSSQEPTPYNKEMN